MNKEFTISIGMKIFYCAIVFFVAGFALYMFYLPRNPNVSPVVLLIPVLLLAGAVMLFLKVFTSKIIINNETISCGSIFGRKELEITSIKGYRIGQKVIFIEPVSNDDSKIIIRNYIDYSNSDELKNWLIEHFADADALDLKTAKEKFEADQHFGATTNERENALRNAKTTAIVYNVVGGVGGFALIFLYGNSLATLCGILFPIVGIIIMVFSHGLIKFISSRKTSVYPFIMIGFFVPELVMFLSGCQYNFYSFANLWLPAIIVSLAMFTALYISGINKDIKNPKGQGIMMFIFASIFGFGIIMNINCQLDKSAPKSYHTTVLNKYTTSGKGRHYHIVLNPWQQGDKSKEIDVSYSEYDHTHWFTR